MKQPTRVMTRSIRKKLLKMILSATVRKLQLYNLIRSLELDIKKDTAKATVEITFAASDKLKRTEPVIVKVTEDLIKQKDGWKIKV